VATAALVDTKISGLHDAIAINNHCSSRKIGLTM
jgi:hypothetical protein